MTATLYELVSNGLSRIYSGKDKVAGLDINEFGIITSIDDPDYLSKIIAFDDEVKEVINSIFSYEFQNKNLDVYVKKTFLDRFIDRSIKWEYIPVSSFIWAPKVFTLKLGSLCAEKDKYLSFLFDEFEKYMTGLSDTVSDDEGKTVNENNNRSIVATLPQDTFNINVRDYISVTADENRLDNSLNDSTRKAHTHSQTNNFNPDYLEKMSFILTTFFDECDKRLFKQIWRSNNI